MSHHRLLSDLSKHLPTIISAAGGAIATYLGFQNRRDLESARQRALAAEDEYDRQCDAVRKSMRLLGKERFSIIRRIMPRVIISAERLSPGRIEDPLGSGGLSERALSARELSQIRDLVKSAQSIEEMDLAKDDPIKKQLLLQGALAAAGMGSTGATVAAHAAQGMALGLGALFGVVQIGWAAYQKKATAEQIAALDRQAAEYSLRSARLTAVIARIAEIRAVTARLSSQTFTHSFLVMHISNDDPSTTSSGFYNSLRPPDQKRIQFFYLVSRSLWKVLAAPIASASGEAARDNLP